MRYLVTPDFSSKLTALTPDDLKQVAAFLKDVESSNKLQLLEGQRHGIKPLGGDVFVLRLGRQTRLYFTFGNDAEGEYVLLLDATTEQGRDASRDLFATKDPRINSLYNPGFNSAINPLFNLAINPLFNSAINPLFNSAINPLFNSAINPLFNSAINPLFNSAINPLFNSAINPLFNSAINPQMNRAFGGPYLYSTNLQQEGYVVRADDHVELLFDLSGNRLGELVRADNEVRVQFNSDNEWEGYVVQANEDVSLRYDLSGTWTGLVV